MSRLMHLHQGASHLVVVYLPRIDYSACFKGELIISVNKQYVVLAFVEDTSRGLSELKDF